VQAAYPEGALVRLVPRRSPWWMLCFKEILSVTKATGLLVRAILQKHGFWERKRMAASSREKQKRKREVMEGQ